jgi:hypothetical protein
LQQRKAELATVAFEEQGLEGGDLGGLDLGDIDYLFGAEADRKAA